MYNEKYKKKSSFLNLSADLTTLGVVYLYHFI